MENWVEHGSLLKILTFLPIKDFCNELKKYCTRIGLILATECAVPPESWCLKPLPHSPSPRPTPHFLTVSPFPSTLCPAPGPHQPPWAPTQALRRELGRESQESGMVKCARGGSAPGSGPQTLAERTQGQGGNGEGGACLTLQALVFELGSPAHTMDFPSRSL